jgi:hypothetical protein
MESGVTTLIILIVVLGAFAAVSVILTVINIAGFSASSQKIAYLEAEVDKKTREFEAMKKQRTDETVERAHIIENGTAEEIDNMLQKGSNDDSQIEIVRSVRTQDTTMLSRETATLHHELLNEFAGHDTSTPLTGSEQNKATQMFADTAGEFQNFTPKPQEAPSAPAPAEKKASVVSEQPQPTPVVIPLFSQKPGGIDLHGAWQTVSDTIQRIPNPYFQLDFSGISTIDSNAAGYLQYFAQTAAQYKAYMAFFNCSPEVEAALKNNPALGPLVLHP